MIQCGYDRFGTNIRGIMCSIWDGIWNSLDRGSDRWAQRCGESK